MKCAQTESQCTLLAGLLNREQCSLVQSQIAGKMKKCGQVTKEKNEGRMARNCVTSSQTKMDFDCWLLLFLNAK